MILWFPSPPQFGGGRGRANGTGETLAEQQTRGFSRLSLSSGGLNLDRHDNLVGLRGERMPKIWRRLRNDGATELRKMNFKRM